MKYEEGKKYKKSDRIDVICKVCGKPGTVSFGHFQYKKNWGGKFVAHDTCHRRASRLWKS